MAPADLFRVERVGARTWSPDGARAAVEIERPGRWIGGAIPTAEIHVVDTVFRKLRRVSSPSREFIGFFAAHWSPNSRKLAFLSVDTNAVVRAWIWTVDDATPVPLRGIQLHDGLADRPTIAWSDEDHVVLLASDTTKDQEGPLYVSIFRDRNAATGWRRAREGTAAAVRVASSVGPGELGPPTRALSVDLRTGAITVLASGALHHPSLSSDGRILTFWRDSQKPLQPKASGLFDPDSAVDNAYVRVNWGGEQLAIDSRTGAPVLSPPMQRPVVRNSAVATLRVVSTPDIGTRLLLIQPGKPDLEVWRGNQWIRDIKPGHPESIAYTSTAGKPLIGWVLYPPGYTSGAPLPIVTIVYPGRLFDNNVPFDFDMLHDDFEHPQLFAALGYAVVMAAMPLEKNPLDAGAIEELPQGVLPLLDTLVRRGIADSARIALLGQSAGGYATLALITQTDRFRTAIASGAYSDLVSEYGTFYGEFRFGDAGRPERAQVLRMLQFERGVFAAGAPPWEQPERYLSNSPLFRASHVHTPIMLVKGESDFIPVEQAEEFFTALYRQDKTAELVSYMGEGHTITARANVLDLWVRMDDWLRRTMSAGRR